MDAWRAGFWPCAAVRIWPITTSDTLPGTTCARDSAARIATSPRVAAGTALRAPLKLPTGVRAAPAMTMSLIEPSAIEDARHEAPPAG